MSSSWTSATPSTKQPQPATPHVCIGGLAISTCAQCAGHPQGYRNPICQQCKGCGVVTETCRQCLLNNSIDSSTNTSRMTSPATSCGNGSTTFEQHMEAYELDFRGFGGDDEEEEPKGKSRQKTGRNNKDQS